MFLKTSFDILELENTVDMRNIMFIALSKNLVD